jgi:hypothetical protein
MFGERRQKLLPEHLVKGVVGLRARGRAASLDSSTERLLKEMYTPQFSVPGQVAAYGLGLSIQPWHGGTFLNHAGGGYGYSAQHYWMPEYGIGVVVLANAQSGSLASDIADRVMLKMIEGREGSVPPNQPWDFSAASRVTVEPDLLRRFAGTYKTRFGLMTFQDPGPDDACGVEAALHGRGERGSDGRDQHCEDPTPDLSGELLPPQGRAREAAVPPAR